MDTASAMLGVIGDAVALIERGQGAQARELLLAVSDALARREGVQHGAKPGPLGGAGLEASTD